MCGRAHCQGEGVSIGLDDSGWTSLDPRGWVGVPPLAYLPSPGPRVLPARINIIMTSRVYQGPSMISVCYLILTQYVNVLLGLKS